MRKGKKIVVQRGDSSVVLAVPENPVRPHLPPLLNSFDCSQQILKRAAACLLFLRTTNHSLGDLENIKEQR